MAALERVDDGYQVKEGGEHFGGIEIIVHEIVQTQELASNLVIQRGVGGGGRVGGRRWVGGGFLQQFVGFPKSFEAFFSGLEGVVAKVKGAAIMGLQDEEADSHRGVGLLEHGVAAGKHLR